MASMAVLATACNGDGEARVIDWDLSSSHTAADVGWAGGLDTREISPVSSLRISLPEGRVLRAGDEVHDVTLERDGDLVRLIMVDFEKSTTEDAYRRAVRLAEEWGLRRDKLDEWVAKRRAQRAQGEEDLSLRGGATAPPGTTIGPGGPAVSVEIRYSFDDAKPSIVSLELVWARDQPAP